MINTNPPPKPWVVMIIKDHGPTRWYRYHVEGENRNFDPPQEFSWAVPSLDDPQYDITNAVRT